jgi:ABC-type lipoprotein release transport system permease subunit
MAWLYRLALRGLWARRWRSLLSLLALALSVGLVVATGSIGALMRAGTATPAPLLGRPADFWISSAYDVDYDLPLSLADEVAAVDGVAEVQPVLRRPVQVLTPSSPRGESPRPDTLTLLGVDLTPYLAFHDLTLAAGTLPSVEAPGLVALAPWAFVRDLGLGQPVTVTTPSGDVALPVTGLVEVASLASAQQGLVLYVPRALMADLFELHDKVTTLEVRLASGAKPRQVRAGLEQALGPAYAAASKHGQSAQLWKQLVLGTLLVVDGLTLAGSVILIYAVFASAARARRREIGLLRMPPPILLLGVAVGLASSLLGSVGPAVRASRQPPVDALRIVPQHTLRRTSGGHRANGDWRGQMLARLVPSLPATGSLAAANLTGEWGRAVLIIGALALILAMALGNVGILSLLSEELAATFGRLAGGDYVVLPALTSISLRELAGQDTSDTPPLSPGLLAALEELEDRVWLMGGTTADVEALQVFPGQPTLLLDVKGYAQMGGFRFQAGDWPSALETFRQGPAVLLVPVVARRLNAGLGDTVQLESPQGPVAFRVAGIGDSEFTTCVLDMADGRTYFGANEVNAVEIQIRPGADEEKVRRALLDGVQTEGGTLLSLGQVSDQLRAIFQQARFSIALLIGITGLVAGLGVVNAMLASVAERRREIGLLRAVGATQRQVSRLILAEMALLGTMAALIGTALGWAVTLLFLYLAQAILGFTGQSASSLAAWQPLLVASAAGMILWPLLAMLGGLAPALHAARQPVIQALYKVS